MDYTNKGFEDIKPTNGQELREYMQMIRQANMPNEFYVQFGTDNIKDTRINCYVQDNVSLLTIEFPTHTEEMGEDKSGFENLGRLIIAKREGKIGDFHEAKKILQDYFEMKSQFSTQDLTKVEECIAKLLKQGWNFTNEGLDIMQITKLNGNTEIKRTEFLENEFTSKTHEQVDKNRKRHLRDVEQSIIIGLEEYIVSKYKQINIYGMHLQQSQQEEKDMEKYIGDVLQYSDKKEKESQDDSIQLIGRSSILLDCAFREMKPISETTVVPIMQRRFSQHIADYLNMIPDSLKENKTELYLREYLQLREDTAEEKMKRAKEAAERAVNWEKSSKTKGEGQEQNDKSERMLNNFITSVDHHREDQNRKNREKLLKESTKMFGLESPEL